MTYKVHVIPAKLDILIEQYHESGAVDTACPEP